MRAGIGLILSAAACVVDPGHVVAQAVPVSARDGIYTQAQAKHGKELYMESCVSCHGDQLQGGKGIPSLSGALFLAKWEKLSVGGLYGFINTQMPLGQPGSLGSIGNVDVVAYILSMNGMPAGPKPLPTDIRILNGAKIGIP